MALQIAQWNLQLNLTGIPANRAYSVSGSNSRLILPTNKNVLIKKIIANGIYNQSGDICIVDFNLFFDLFNFNNTLLNTDSAKFVSSPFVIDQNAPFLISIGKKNPVLNLDIIAGGLSFINSTAIRNSIILNNSTSPINSTISIFLTICYEKY